MNPERVAVPVRVIFSLEREVVFGVLLGGIQGEIPMTNASSVQIEGSPDNLGARESLEGGKCDDKIYTHLFVRDPVRVLL